MLPLKQLQNLRAHSLLISFGFATLGFYFFLKMLPFWLLSSMGFEAEIIEQFLKDNEILLQFLSLAIGQLLFKRAHDRQFPAELGVSSFWLPLTQAWNTAWGAAFRGFALASVGVALTLFLGLSSIERPLFDLQGFWLLAPTLFFQVAVLFFWLWTLEWVRSRWVPLLLNRDPAAISWRVAYIIWEAFFYYQVFGGANHSLGIFLVVMLSLLASSSLFLWFELDHRKTSRNPQAFSLRRMFFQWGLLSSLIHLWGLGWGQYRAVSYFRIFEGPLELARRFRVDDLVPVRIFFIFLLALFINALLQRVLKKHSASS